MMSHNDNSNATTATTATTPTILEEEKKQPQQCDAVNSGGGCSSSSVDNDNNNMKAPPEQQQQTQQQQQQQQYCSYAVTGPQTSFQSIFVCYTCSGNNNGGNNNNNNNELHCVCQACADSCHADHDGLEYLGIGPSYCDCRLISGDSCKIQKISQDEAARLNVANASSSGSGGIGATIPTCASATQSEVYIRDAYTIPMLIEQQQQQQQPQENDGDDGSSSSSRSRSNTAVHLQKLSHELIRHSKETFWIDDNDDDATKDASKMCDLEKLACAIYNSHKQKYATIAGSATTTTAPKCRGCEWWVQVKPISYPAVLPQQHQQYQSGGGSSSFDCKPAATVPSTEAVDLHYDKDEALAQSFGLASFPALSTVTYLTNCHGAPPTVVLNRRYDEVDDNNDNNNNQMISDVMISHPRQGKHIVFDGRLLHGAPAHYALREAPPPVVPLQKETNNDNNGNNNNNGGGGGGASSSSTTCWSAAGPPLRHGDSSAPHCRITFLVNIWIDHKPAGIEPLPNEIRQHLLELTNKVTATDNPMNGNKNGSTTTTTTTTKGDRLLLSNARLEPCQVSEVHISGEKDLGGGGGTATTRIDLPFVGKGTTWGSGGFGDDDDDADEDGVDCQELAVSMYPPPTENGSRDTLFYRYGPTVSAYIYSPNSSIDYDDDDNRMEDIE